MKTPHRKAIAITIMVATRKGAWFFHGDSARRKWRVVGPYFLGSIIHHVVMDPRDGKTVIAAASSGHLGPTIFRSADRGRTWKESSTPPAFPKLSAGVLDANGLPARIVKHTFWLSLIHI